LRDFRGQSCINDFLLVEYISSFFNETARANLVATSVEMLGYRIPNVAEVKSVSSAVLEASEISGNVVKGGASLSLSLIVIARETESFPVYRGVKGRLARGGFHSFPISPRTRARQGKTDS